MKELLSYIELLRMDLGNTIPDELIRRLKEATPEVKKILIDEFEILAT